MAFNNQLLHYFLEDALKAYSEDFIITDTSNPVLFSLNGMKYSAHISYVHDSGEGRPNNDEARIQLQRGVIDKQQQNLNDGYIPIFIGFYNDGSVFSAWDSDYIFSLSFANTGSVYARKSHFGKVNINGAALRRQQAQNLNRNTSIIALPSDALGLYIENIKLFHQIENERDLQTLISDSSRFIDKSSKYPEEKIEYEFTKKGKREKILIVSKRTAYPRNPKFANAVMQAYGAKCAICAKQLNIVQAAHIVPHCNDQCQDDIKNGIALCVEHHALYDNALLMPDKNKKLFLNHEKISFLQAIGQTNGLEEVTERSQYDYSIPTDKNHQPSSEYLELGINIRLGKVS